MASRSSYIQNLHQFSRLASGTSFILLMEHDVNQSWSKGVKDYSIHARFNQPCQGGELRKYKCSHKEGVTQPHNTKPRDLNHPFPEGRPSAVAFPLGGQNYPRGIVLETVFSETSPWRKGFGGVENIEFLTNDKGQKYGVLIGRKDLNVDPTVMVNAIWAVRDLSDAIVQTLVDAGMTPIEAVATAMLNGNQVTTIGSTNSYHFPNEFSARRFFEGKPRDLSGGLYSQRVDYNRTWIQDVFSCDPGDEGTIVWYYEFRKVIEKRGLYNVKKDKYGFETMLPLKIEDFVACAKEVFETAIANEPEVVEKPYVYRDASGNEKTLNLKLPKAA